MTSMPPPEPPRPFDAIMLDVGDGHWLYVEEVGRKGGIPALFLHGGPGSGCQHAHRRLFDGDRYHAVLFDQRGAGRSHPYLETRANTTQHLVADIERIRDRMGFEKMLIVGGSWGSTLALAYAEAHPERVSALVLRAVFLGTDAEVDWAFRRGPAELRPDLYASFVGALPEAERADPIAAYVARLTSADASVRDPAAHRWNRFERIMSEFAPGETVLADDMPLAGRLPPTPIMEAHYIANHFFLAPDQLLADAERLAGIPGVIVQGRYDLLCPPRAAYELARRWPAAQLEIVPSAGHAMTEPGVFEAMKRAVDSLAGMA
ncbi:prolyl aminopeptidase [Hyphomicrobium sp.]|uniref:prolyl aminopeptidase n=1 Tax=Hyphomicrobium sp. TaxID=82 RepID=UPI002B9E7854|nr:prolyl aminopeptidase [Hyphomicrobium sp.]HRN89544.1 prolyl aminopeptidase [Hyphomicrobium sp.]HRQ27253.1 prolyl aminopeptidase [Hyphomicrobium sp.]